jgi:c-di-GMP-binding flagellar brake protein YcgR
MNFQRLQMAESVVKNVNQNFTDDIKTYIAINELLQVRFLDDPNTATYYSRINDIAEGRLIIAWPTQAGIRLLVHTDQILDFYFMRDDVPHEFTGMVDEMYPDPPPQIAIILSSAVSRVQRRQNFRIKSLIPVEITGTIKDPRDDSVTVLNLKTITCDLSASGMAIRHAKLIPEGTTLEIKLALPDNAPVIKLPCQAIHSEVPAEKQNLYRTGLRYLAISESERARIVRYVYRTQLKGLHP